jgi:processive 1,2-diacylglycerol beta-glucosyltransferase
MAVKILVASVSAGAGHKRAGEALELWGRRRLGDDAIKHVDALAYASKVYGKLYAGSYLKMADSAPELWGYLFSKWDKQTPKGKKLMDVIDRAGTQKFKKFVLEGGYDALIATHFMPAEILLRQRRKGKFDGKIFIVVTDFDVHRFWILPEADGYFAATEDAAEVIRLRGVDKDKIFTTGIPVMPQFSEPADRGEVLGALGLDKDMTTMLIMSGGFGIGAGARKVAGALDPDRPVQAVFVCGKNEKMKSELEKFEFPKNVRPKILGFVSDMWRLMQASDVIITKPGGLTVSEALAVKLPIIVVDPIPGQEDRNADFLLENGLALKGATEYSLKIRINRVLADPSILARMRRAAAHFSKPYAGRDVIKKVLEMLQR